MLIASQKRKENIAEYLLYMWQLEDLLRAYKFDIETIQKNIIDQFDQPDEMKKEIRIWYENLITMMQEERVTEKGHLQINTNILISLNDLHQSLMQTSTEQTYQQIYYQTLPVLLELQQKMGNEYKNELESCFTALYGVLLLKLQGKDISTDTQTVIRQISKFLAVLAEKYKHANVPM